METVEKVIHASAGAQKLQAWMPLLDTLPLECDGMTRCVSTLLSRDGIEHEVHYGYVAAHGLKKHINPHLWVELGQGLRFDIRARMWLANHESAPHGLFLPTEDFEYCTRNLIPASDFRMPDHLFWIVFGASLDDFK